MSDPRHFLDLDKLEAGALRDILARGNELKSAWTTGDRPKPFDGKTLVMIFEKPSTRTRVSFQVGMQQLGGMVVVMGEQESQLGHGETPADTARVLSRYADAIMIRTDDPTKLVELEKNATVPVINGLTDDSHPCQIMADVMTYEEVAGPIAGRVVAWCGDANNVANSWIHASAQFGFEFRIASPEEFRPTTRILDWAEAHGARVSVSDDPVGTVSGADCVVTDTWVSMGDAEAAKRRAALEPFRVDAALMAKAADKAVFMHCLPVYRGDEATAEVVDGPQSVIWTEAGNRLHAQKSILLWCLLGDAGLA